MASDLEGETEQQRRVGGEVGRDGESVGTEPQAAAANPAAERRNVAKRALSRRV